MKKLFSKFAFALLTVALVAPALVSCGDDDDDKVKTYDLTLAVNLPAEVASSNVKDLVAVITKDETSQEVAISGTSVVVPQLPQGTYNITVTGKVIDDATAYLQGVSTVDLYEEGKTATVALDVVRQSTLIFKSIYTTGGKLSYTQDGYFEIVNNSDEVQYLDQLILMYCSLGKAPNAWQAAGIYDPYYMAQGQAWAFPGNGTDYPLQPGESVLLANDATDHTAADPAGVHADLTNADWEFYIDHATVGGGDIDYAAPNLKEIYYTNAGMRAFALGFFNGGYLLGKLPDGITPEQFAADEANLSTTPGTTSTTLWLGLPSKYVLDAVMMFDPDEEVQNHVFLPKDDANGVQASEAWAGKCLRRKVIRIENGRPYYQDTNNSAADFLNNQPLTPGVTPTTVD